MSAKAWTHRTSGTLDFVLEAGAISAACEQSPRFLAEFEGEPGAAAALWIHDGVAVFAGAATVPQMRGKGCKRHSFRNVCDTPSSMAVILAMMVAEAGSNSQRNPERKGFRIAYTRTKWRLSREGQTI